MPFYVSVVVLPTDDPCHLPDYPVPAAANRTKAVAVSIARGQRYREYMTPIGFSLVISLLLVGFAFVVMATKRLGDDEDEDDIVDEPSVYYSPKESREQLEFVTPDSGKRRRRLKIEGEGDPKEEEEEKGFFLL